MDEDPSNEVFILSLLQGYSADEAKAMDKSQPSRGRLASQVHHLDGSRGASLGSIGSQTRRQDGQIIHPY
jgi:hypothetical protein